MTRNELIRESGYSCPSGGITPLASSRCRARELAGWWAMLALLCLLPTPVRAIDPGYATGNLKVGGESYPLTHACVYQYHNDEKILEGPELRILLADREVSQRAISGFNSPRFALVDMARRGEVHGILLKKTSHKGKPVHSMTLLLPVADSKPALPTCHSERSDILQKLKTSQNRTMGELHFSWAGGRDLTECSPFEVEARFSAPFFRDDPVTRRFKGKAAVATPQVQALLALDDALRTGDHEAVRPLATSGRFGEISLLRSWLGETAFRAALRREVPSRNARLGQIREVVVHGPRAVVVTHDEAGTTGHDMIYVGDGWKVD